MSHHYAPLPNPRIDNQAQRDQEEEMAAAFDYSEDEDDDHDPSETQPLNSQSSSNPPHTPSTPPAPRPARPQPSTYDFENVDYDYPPPGSPPLPSSRALPNDIGNSNGLIPSFDETVQPPRRNWFQRAAASVLPPRVADKVGLSTQRLSGPVGSGIFNDGVFANVTAKPTAPTRIQEGDNTYLVPEDAGNDAPPSYQTAQADAVPPYWETTVHAPFSPDSAGEMIIDSLPTGSVFSFLWNMLVSVSFQFVGFLLTYLLHTTHAARLGSRAGLGITLIQYGFALRERLDEETGRQQPWRDNALPPPPFTTGGDSDPFLGDHRGFNFTSPTSSGPIPDDQTVSWVGDATTEWLSFFLMTVGWFILLTSLLGFWRVKRWERGILASQRESTAAAQPSAPRNLAVVSRIEQVLGLQGVSRGDLFRQGFGFGRNRNQDDEEVAVVRAEQGEGRIVGATTQHPLLPLDPDNPEGNRILLQAIENEHRLRTELRNAGLV
ncbi:hypothetical protein D9756_000493 [Leucocoprinus leucothites]|uniref:Metal homeostatis protein bsd2 n=1 Tax=Leucocoprinus leucothites TaxID=201217 RepID=A0A8H5GEM9_9AGAR|nr:hypothetical protein D9756_000493 [Leucoagaricus leucothites]